MEDDRVPELIDESIAMPTPVGLPELIRREGAHAEARFIEFFTAAIRNRGTRAAYVRAATDFLAWCDRRGVSLGRMTPVVPFNKVVT